MSQANADLIRENFARFARGEGEAVYATWADDAVFHVLDATRYHGNYSRDEYFTMLATTWGADTQDYQFTVVSCEAYGDDLVVAHLKSIGTHIDGPIDERGGLMIYRIANRKIVEGWALGRGTDATTPF
jgi:hypothetical protein